MNNKLKLGLFIVAVIFTIVIATAPPRVGENRSLIDSLRQRAYNAERREQKALERAKRDSIMSDTWFKEAERLRVSKTIYIIKYKIDTAKINRLSDPELDSAIRATYPDK